MRTRRTIPTIVLTVLTALAVPAAAASGPSTADSIEDVWRISGSGGVERNTVKPEVDVIRVLATTPTDTGAGSSQVTLQLELAADPTPVEGVVAFAFGAEGATDVQSQGTYGVAVSKTEAAHALYRIADGAEFGCPGSTHRWVSARIVEVSFDSACIRAPKTLPVAAQTIGFSETESDFQFWTDFAPNISNPDQMAAGTGEPVQKPAFTLSLPGAGTGIAPVARDVADTCSGAPTGRFSDTAGTTHEATIDCAAHRGITEGKGDGRYAPGEYLRRDQIASFLARTLREGGVALPAASEVPDYYTDDEKSVHQANINVMTHVGVLDLESGSQFRPGDRVSRADMARMVANALGVHHDTTELAPDYFTDDDGEEFEAEIGRVAMEGVVTGKGGGRYAPVDSLRRDQMATFLVRLLDAIS